MEVFLLHHVHEFSDGEEDMKLIGVYSSEERAEEAKQRALTLLGFRDLPDGFSIDHYTVDADHWSEVFTSWAEALEDSSEGAA